MRLTLPYPPSTNRYWRSHRGRAPHLSEEARGYRARVKWLAMGARVQPLKGEVRVSVALYRPQRSGDLDNRLKPLLDALRGIAYADDDQVVELHALRLDDRANPRVEVMVETAMPAKSPETALPSTNATQDRATDVQDKKMRHKPSQGPSRGRP